MRALETRSIASLQFENQMTLNKLSWIVCLIGLIGFNKQTLALAELDCVIEPQTVVEITSASAGLLEPVLVERGEQIKNFQNSLKRANTQVRLYKGKLFRKSLYRNRDR